MTEAAEWQALSELRANVARNAAGFRALIERVDYLTVATGRGDPRFTREEFATPDFDTVAFDEWWASKGKRVPPLDEIFSSPPSQPAAA